MQEYDISELQKLLLNNKELSSDEYKFIINRRSDRIKDRELLFQREYFSNKFLDYLVLSLTADMICDTKYLQAACKFMMNNMYRARDNHMLVIDDSRMVRERLSRYNTLTFVRVVDEVEKFDRLFDEMDSEVKFLVDNDIFRFNDSSVLSDEIIALESSHDKILSLRKKYI